LIYKRKFLSDGRTLQTPGPFQGRVSSPSLSESG
jgi:hypothetical protein